MEPPVRIELTTCRLQGGCSTTELERQDLRGVIMALESGVRTPLSIDLA